jgi:signal transduction histidine kinase/DNA-binding response OmpR family regulator
VAIYLSVVYCVTLFAEGVEDGFTGHAVGILRDISERKKVEEELRRYKDQLEEKVQLRTVDLVLARNAAEAANKAKSVFLSSMSHELRTPLNAILGFSNMMRKDPLLLQEQRENLDIINRSGEHLLTLINDVLEMAKIEAGRVQLESAPFDLGGLVRDVTDMMHMRAQEKGLQLLVDQSSEFPRYIKGDEARVRQVLINLLGNAVKFTQQGGVTVRFGMKPHATPPRLLIEVEDSGIGIKPEDQQRIFEPFVQLGQTAAQTGTGLGLTITRQFVQLMGGAISVESTPGVGSTFRVELPLEKADAADVLKPESVARGDIVGLAPGQPEYRILIVEDQLENQLLLARLMQSVGFPVKVAENGEQGVQLFQSWQPHLIWMDRRMPVMDGLEATRRIRELPGGTEVKIVAVTASAFTEQRDEMLKAGMDDFVRKPYRFNEIYETLSKQLGVQYTYADADALAAEEENDVVLTAQMLAALPQDMRRELHDALESLENERISAVIGQVESHDVKLHKTLLQLAANYDYPAILKALQTN